MTIPSYWCFEATTVDFGTLVVTPQGGSETPSTVKLDGATAILGVGVRVELTVCDPGETGSGESISVRAGTLRIRSWR